MSPETTRRAARAERLGDTVVLLVYGSEQDGDRMRYERVPLTPAAARTLAAELLEVAARVERAKRPTVKGSRR